jgi:hypothetical protein
MNGDTDDRHSSPTVLVNRSLSPPHILRDECFRLTCLLSVAGSSA